MANIYDQPRPGLIRETLGDAIGAICVFAIPYAFGLIFWAIN